jgi:hypothetical protein
MLLNPEQIVGLRTLQRERDLALLGEQLALAFPRRRRAWASAFRPLSRWPCNGALCKASRTWWRWRAIWPAGSRSAPSSRPSRVLNGPRRCSLPRLAPKGLACSSFVAVCANGLSPSRRRPVWQRLRSTQRSSSSMRRFRMPATSARSRTSASRLVVAAAGA